MCGNLACIAVVVLGIDVGWQPLPDGGVEYLIQIEPAVLETRKADSPIESHVPPYVQDIRAVRVTVGSSRLPRQLPPTPQAEPSSDPLPEPAPLPGAEAPQPSIKPLAEQAASHDEPAQSSPLQAEPSVEGNTPPQEPGKPWLPLTAALFGLFASLGLNVFLVWIAGDFRKRYRALAGRIPEPT